MCVCVCVCVRSAVYMHFCVSGQLNCNHTGLNRSTVVLPFTSYTLTSVYVVSTFRPLSQSLSLCVPHVCTELTPEHLFDLRGHYNCEVPSSQARSNTIACISPWLNAIPPLTVRVQQSRAKLGLVNTWTADHPWKMKLPLEVLFVGGQWRTLLP